MTRRGGQISSRAEGVALRPRLAEEHVARHEATKDISVRQHNVHGTHMDTARSDGAAPRNHACHRCRNDNLFVKRDGNFGVAKQNMIHRLGAFEGQRLTTNQRAADGQLAEIRGGVDQGRLRDHVAGRSTSTSGRGLCDTFSAG